MGPQVDFTDYTYQGFGRDSRINDGFSLLDDFFQFINNPIKIFLGTTRFKEIGHCHHRSLYKTIRRTLFFFVGPYSPEEPVEDVTNNHGKISHFPKITGLLLFNHAVEGIRIL